MKRILLAALLFFGVTAAHAQCPNPQNFATSSAITASGATQLIAAPGLDPNTGRAMSIHICSATIAIIQATGAANFGFVTGTGTNCATGTATLKLFPGVSSYTQSWGQVYGSNPVILPPGTALCLNLSAAPTGATADVQYSIY